MRLQPRIQSPKPTTATSTPPAQTAVRGSLNDAIGLMGAVMPYYRNVEIFGEGEPAEYFYRVIRGAARTYKMTSDGRRQIGAFYLPGDIFGLEANPINRVTAEAVLDSSVLVVKRSLVIALAARDANVARELWGLTAKELERLQQLTLTLGRKTAQERVAGFLLEMAARARKGATLQLPMSRQDIADYLGLTIETVSRTIALLVDTATIDVPSSRRIVLRDAEALAHLSG